ncbi:ATP-binding cassette domain-containing protein [Alloscardovia omnicolens]|uniref:ATP-binding cassette domain-containing protein n=1 Tax=Alloscardovia omnicolens TaxID=419015 RepID=UPI003A618C4A
MHKHASEQVTNKNYNSKSEQGTSTKFFADRAQTVSTRRKSNDDRRLEALAQSEIRKPRYENLSLHFPEPTNKPRGVMVSARNFSVSTRLSPVSFSVYAGDHLLITGPNGAGKSTLLRCIHEKAPIDHLASTGTIDAQTSAFVPQNLPHGADELISEDSWHSGIGDIAKGFLHPQYWPTPIQDLSDGNKRRAQLAVALSHNPSVLLIDEPTNYLDLDTIESLEKAMKSWEGTLIISSHDQWLIKNWTGSHLTIHPAP